MKVQLLGDIGLLTFGALSWIILLASVSALHEALTDFPGIRVADNLGLVWWVVWCQFLLLVAMALLAALGALKKGASVLGNFLAAVFALEAYVAHEASTLVRAWQDVENVPTKYISRAQAVLAGIILTALSTALLIIWLGSFETIVERVRQTDKKLQDSGLPTGAPAGAQYYAKAAGASHNGYSSEGLMMPPPPVAVLPDHHSPPPLPPGNTPPLGYNAEPGAHPIPGVSGSPGEVAYPQPAA